MELEVNGFNYRIGKLNAFTQLHVSRRIAPAFLTAKSSENELLSITEAFQRMNDSDVDYIVNACLSACMRQDQNNWQKIQSSPGTLQYQDIELPTIIRLCIETIKFNLGDFTRGLFASENASQPEQA